MVEVRTVGRELVPAVVVPLVRAFWDFPETVHLLPSERARRRVLPRYLTSDALDAVGFGTLFAAVDADEVVGAAAWVPPGGYPIGLARQSRAIWDLVPTLPWTWRQAQEAARGQRGNRSRHEGRPPHYWLRAVGVDPAHQHRGVGRALLRAGLDRADEEGVGSFLFTATTENAGWYEHFGFRTEEQYRPTPRWPTVWAMWRDPA